MRAVQLRVVGLTCLTMLCATVAPAAAQQPLEARAIAARIADAVSAVPGQRIVVIGPSPCRQSVDSCKELDEKVRSAISTLPGVQIVSPQKINTELKREGFLTIDQYFEEPLRSASLALGADILVREEGDVKGATLFLSFFVTDFIKGNQFGEFATTIKRPYAGSASTSQMVVDENTGIALFPVPDGSVPFGHPICDVCPSPEYTPQARKAQVQGLVKMLATVTDRGRATDIHVLSGLGYGLDEEAVKTLKRWRFKPAVWPDGKKHGARVVVEVGFRLI